MTSTSHQEVEVTITLTLSLPMTWNKPRIMNVVRHAIDISELAPHVAPDTAPTIVVREEAAID